MLNTTNYTRTIWNRDSYRIPTGSNLYGYVGHPVVIIGSHAPFCTLADPHQLLTKRPELTPYTTTTAATTELMLSSC